MYSKTRKPEEQQGAALRSGIFSGGSFFGMHALPAGYGPWSN